jgi:ion channel POLLUX/CASTOR
VITTGMGRKLEELRRGRSTVLEHGHTLILGWSAKIFTVISELSIANENQSRRVIVVLGDEDKVTMEEAIRARVPDTHGTRIVCRTGNSRPRQSEDRST